MQGPHFTWHACLYQLQTQCECMVTSHWRLSSGELFD